ncbi:hypothetical protein OS242_05775 [Tumebacillus sp. DT12]|uniref:Fibronectin type-III domain-containing protein n=1 Tax=Tumebacillus lacus TaxID=2995335 RepID=A0ABT3WXR0_9BACL|nr:hypothetical protein [Tumebacillus lacus]MCX7569463.1 hypothetical protein [Tumebacillus lacus]
MTWISRAMLLPLVAAGAISAQDVQPAQAALPADLTAVQIGAGSNHSLTVMADGTVWGFGRADAFGSGLSGGVFPTPTQGISDVKAVSGGEYNTVYLKQDKTVWFSGTSYLDGTVIKYPAPVSGLSNIETVAAGDQHALALDANGDVWAWGSNTRGQLGDGTVTSASTPKKVAGLGRIIFIAAGVKTSFAIDENNNLYGWGSNDGYQLGVAGTVNTKIPSVIMTNIKGVSTHNGHTLAVTKEGDVWGFGSNSEGQLGPVNKGGTYSKPTSLNISGAEAVEVGNAFSLILKSDHTVLSMGSNGYGQLGSGTLVNQDPIPTQIPDLVNVEQIQAGARHAVARLSDGTVWAWGYNDTFQAGVEKSYKLSVKTPQKAHFLKASAISNSQTTININYEPSDPSVVGSYLVVDGAREVCTGLMTHCQDNGLYPDTLYTHNVRMYDKGGIQIGKRTLMTRTLRYAKLAAGEYHTVNVTTNRKLSNFGFNQYGQVGDGTLNDRYSPFTMTAISDAVDVAAGYGFTVAKKGDGTLWAWGRNEWGQLGNGTTANSLTPVQVNLTGSVQKMASKYEHVLAIMSDGTVYGWGRNNFGELGLGHFTSQSVPVKIPGLSSVSDVKMGFGHFLILKTDGTVWAMGRNDQGQLGNGTTKGSTTPIQVQGLTNVKAIAAGSLHNLALKTDGTVWAWGYNQNGQLGNGAMKVNELTPKKVTTLTGVKEIAAGYGHSLALKTDGTVWGFGYNHNGQLGDGTRNNTDIPVQTLGIATGSKLVAGGINGYAELADGTYRVWGGNSYGAYGDGTNNYSTTAVKMYQPTGLAVYADTTTTDSMYIAWKTAPATTGTVYKLYRNGALLYQGSNLNFTDTGLSAYTPYTYKVEAYQSTGTLIETKTVVSATVKQPSLADDMMEEEGSDYFKEEYYPLNASGLEY